jgi:cell division protein FtsB
MRYNNSSLSQKIKDKAPVIIFGLALIFIALAFFGDDSYLRLQAIKSSLNSIQHENENTKNYINSLKNDIIGLQTNNRTLEKAARNELGMSRPDEMVIIFDEDTLE